MSFASQMSVKSQLDIVAAQLKVVMAVEQKPSVSLSAILAKDAKAGTTDFHRCDGSDGLSAPIRCICVNPWFLHFNTDLYQGFRAGRAGETASQRTSPVFP